MRPFIDHSQLQSWLRQNINTSKDAEFYDENFDIGYQVDQDLNFGIGQLNFPKPALCK